MHCGDVHAESSGFACRDLWRMMEGVVTLWSAVLLNIHLFIIRMEGEEESSVGGNLGLSGESSCPPFF